jgi:hypothetical protein
LIPAFDAPEGTPARSMATVQDLGPKDGWGELGDLFERKALGHFHLRITESGHRQVGEECEVFSIPEFEGHTIAFDAWRPQQEQP